jgi:HTH-type transcriptional regulator/antitoxin HigA
MDANRKDIDEAMPTRRMPLVPARSRPVAKPKYLALVRKFPLRLIRSEQENEAALAVIEALGERQRVRPLEPEEHDYIAVLAKLIEEYENEHYPSGPVSGTAMLAHLIEAKGINKARLAADTGLAESTISQLLQGKRKLSRHTIARFANYFRVEPSLFADA